MKCENIWLRQQTLRKAAKRIAIQFFPKPARKDIYSTCLALGPEIIDQYDRETHGEIWPWVFLNMLAAVDGKMCAMMVFVVCEGKTPWQVALASRCLLRERAAREKTSTTRATFSAPMCL